MNPLLRPLVACVLLLGVTQSGYPQDSAAESTNPRFDPTQVVAYQGDVRLTHREIDAAFSKLPEAEQPAFIRDGGKVDQLIQNLLRRKVIAADAVAAGFDQDPLIAALMQLEAEKVLADAWIRKVVEEAPAADYEALAYEDYVANPDAYRSPENLDVSHILIATEECASEDALTLATRLVSELRQDPEKFDALVAEYSDDPAKEANGGRYPQMRRGMMAAPFEKAAFALQEPGAISEPVRTEYGWHIIRLNARSGNELQDFDAVRKQAMARAERRYFDTYRENYLRKVLTEQVVIPVAAVEIMAKRHFGENLERAPNARQ